MADLPPRQLASSRNGRASGKPWKSEKAPTTRAHLQPALKAKSWVDRQEKAKRERAIKLLQTELKEEKQAEIARRKQITAERKQALEERHRAEELKAQLGARKAARLRKKAGRSKKIHQ